MIKLQNVVKTYGDLVAVDGINLTIDKGEVVGLLGPNGAGKSTTMKLITGFLVSDSGEVTIDEVQLKENPIDAKRKIGYMPENNPLYKEMLVEDALNFALALHNIPAEEKDERLDYVVRVTGIEKVFYRPIAELSKGYKQRVGLAQVLVHDPEILILDEPTEGLDPNQRNEIRNLIRDLGKDRTVIISTHVMQEVEAMCNRIVIINKGQIVLDGDRKKVLGSKHDQNEIFIKVHAARGLTEDAFNIKELEALEIINTESGVTTVRFSTKNPVLFYEEFSKLLKNQNDWVLHELRTTQQNLEDIFRELTH